MFKKLLRQLLLAYALSGVTGRETSFCRRMDEEEGLEEMEQGSEDDQDDQALQTVECEGFHLHMPTQA